MYFVLDILYLGYSQDIDEKNAVSWGEFCMCGFQSGFTQIGFAVRYNMVSI